MKRFDSTSDLRWTLENAERLAAEGLVRPARFCLDAGVRLADRAAARGEPQADSLAAELRRLLARFEAEHPLPPE